MWVNPTVFYRTKSIEKKILRKDKYWHIPTEKSAFHLAKSIEKNIEKR